MGPNWYFQNKGVLLDAGDGVKVDTTLSFMAEGPKRREREKRERTQDLGHRLIFTH